MHEERWHMALEDELPDHLPGRQSLPIEASGIKENIQAPGAGHAESPPDHYIAYSVQEGKLQTQLETKEYPVSTNAVIKNHHR